MKGTLHKTEQGWRVQYSVINSIRSLPLHRDDISDILSNPDSKIENLVCKEVEFEMVKVYTDSHTNQVQSYAKLIHHSVESNEMIDHIGDTNKMVCVFEPKTDITSATICKHCGQEKFLHNQVPDVRKMVEEYGATCNQLYKEWLKIGFEAGYNKAKETLYTEEQVVASMLFARTFSSAIKDEDYIQSIKQSK